MTWTPKKEEPAYRALVGINYLDSEKEEHRVEQGDKITNMTENAVKSELKAGNIEEWVPEPEPEVVPVVESEQEEVPVVESKVFGEGELS